MADELTRARRARYDATAKGRARHARYNTSEKGWRRSRRYEDSEWGTRTRLWYERARTARRIERDDPEFAAYLRGEIAFEDLTPLPKLRPLNGT